MRPDTTRKSPVAQPRLISYPEIEYVRWCRARAVDRGESPNGALYCHIYQRDRHIFESELRQHQRLARGPSDLEPLGDLLEVLS